MSMGWFDIGFDCICTLFGFVFLYIRWDYIGALFGFMLYMAM
jgi:hypothetical protein